MANSAAEPIISAEDAIKRALEIDDHFECREFLGAWLHGDWSTVRDFLTPDLLMVCVECRR